MDLRLAFGSPSPTRAVRGRAKLLVVAVTAAVALSAASGTGSRALAQTPPVRYLDIVFERVVRTNDLVYGRAMDIPSGRPVDLKLDLYEPQGDSATARAVLMFVHGGGFTGGDKSAGQRWALEFARRGWVVASIGYRLNQGNVPTVGIPAAVSDARQAVRWLQREAPAHRLDTSRIVVAGSSAGAITVLFLAYTETELGPDDASSDVAGVMDLWGALYGRENEMDAGEPPLIIVHGTEDRVVPYHHAEALRSRALAVGIPHDFRPLQGVGHGSNETAMISSWAAAFFHPLLWPAPLDPTPVPSPTPAPSATPSAVPTLEATSLPSTATPTASPPSTRTPAQPGARVFLPAAIAGR